MTTEDKNRQDSSMDAAPFHDAIPAPITSFIGRGGDVQAIENLLEQSRLVTITGIGGMGKTRLAVQVARESLSRFRHGVCFVSIEMEGTERTLEEVIGNELNITFRPPLSPFDRLVDYLGEKELLLVLDGFEHVEREWTVLTNILQVAPNVRLLVTTRRPHSSVQGAEYPLGGLSVTPDASDPTGPSDAMHFFADSARRNRSSFELSSENYESVHRICQRLDGMPMAIEQVASWVRILSVAEIAEEIDASIGSQDFTLLGDDVEAILVHSWSLLSESEQKIVCRLSIFPSNFDLAAAKMVSGGTLADLASLHNKAMLMLDEKRRYRLHSLIRAYSLANAHPPERIREPQQRFLHYYFDILSGLHGGAYSLEAIQSMAKIQSEANNVRSAWLLALDLQEYAILIKHVDALFWYFILSTDHSGGADLIGRLVQALGSIQSKEETIDPIVLATIRAQYAYLLVDRKDQATASHHLALARQVAHEHENKHLLFLCHLAVAIVAHFQSEFSASVESTQAALEVGAGAISANERIHVQIIAAHAAAQVGSVRIAQDAVTDIEQLIDERALPFIQAHLMACRSRVALLQDDLPEAILLLESTVKHIQETLKHPNQAALSLHTLGFYYTLSPLPNAFERAEAVTLSARQVFESIGDRLMLGKSSRNLGIIDRTQLRFTSALAHFQQALNSAQEMGERDGLAIIHFNTGDLLARVGLYQKAKTHFEEGLKIGQETRLNHSYIKLAQAMTVICDDHLGTWASPQAEPGAALAKQLPTGLINLHIWPHVGELCLRRNDLNTAQHIYTTIYERRSSVHHIKRHDGAAGLAQIALRRGDLDAAMAYVDTILDDLEDGRIESLLGTDLPFHISYYCYQVLAEAGDARADKHLRNALAWLNRVADDIEDSNMRHTFLHDVPVHAKLQAANQTGTQSDSVESTPEQEPEPTVESLTPRELEVVQLVSQGLSNQQIGERLVITKATVRRHLANIYGKLGINNRVKLTNQAANFHLIDPPN